eukprot:scaffold63493_cov69-Phaeocystis_antarctica.AAC.6
MPCSVRLQRTDCFRFRRRRHRNRSLLRHVHACNRGVVVQAAHVAVPEEDGNRPLTQWQFRPQARLNALRVVERAPAREVRRLAAGICAPHKLGKVDSPWHAVVSTERCATETRPRCHPRLAALGIWPHPAPPWRASLSGG